MTDTKIYPLNKNVFPIPASYISYINKKALSLLHFTFHSLKKQHGVAVMLFTVEDSLSHWYITTNKTQFEDK